MDYLTSGMLSMLRSGLVSPEMGFQDVQAACDEPDIHEFEDVELPGMLARWESAKKMYTAERERS